MSLIKFKSENQNECPGYLQGEGTQGLIVLQEWWGMNNQIKAEAKDIGDRGKFVTLVPDLYRGKVTDDREEAGHFMGDLNWDGAIKDIQGAAKYLLEKGCTKVGVTGFCMGGALSLAAAVKVPEISACAPFYGIPSADKFDVTTINIPVEAHFGEDDALEGFSSQKDAKALEKKMKDSGRNFTLHMYEGCGHAFTNAIGPLKMFNRDACELAFTRLVKFMNDNLK